jgi:hypothetical protein
MAAMGLRARGDARAAMAGVNAAVVGLLRFGAL